MTAPETDLVMVGTVARAFGRRGQVIVNSETDFPESRFSPGSTIYVMQDGRAVEMRIVTTRFQRGRPVLAFDRIDTMTAAEQLRGCELRVPESMLSPLPEDTYYAHDLIGCAVRTVSGETVGVVTEVQGPSGAQRLIVGRGRHEVDVPLVDGICVSIDIGARTIRVDPPDGLLELNVPGGRE